MAQASSATTITSNRPAESGTAETDSPVSSALHAASFAKVDPVLRMPDWVFILIATSLINTLALAMPLLLLQVYDRIVPQHAADSLSVLLLVVGSAILTEAGLRFLRQMTLAQAAIRFERSASAGYLRYFLATVQPPSVKHDGRLLRVLSALADWREAYVGPYFATLCDLPFVALYIGLIAMIAGKIAYIPLVMWLVGLWLWCRTQGSLARLLAEQTMTDYDRARFSWMALESRAQTRSLYDFGLLKADYAERLAIGVDKARLVQHESRKIIDIAALLIEISVVATVCVGASFVINGHLTTGALAAATLLTARALQPLQQLASHSSRAAQFDAASRDLAEFSHGGKWIPATNAILANGGERQTSNDNSERPIGVDLSAATLRRQDDGRFIFKDICFSLKPGEFAAMTGPSGSGKTALLQTIAGLSPLDSGEVLLGGVKSEEFFRVHRPGSVALVLQSEILLQASIIDNLTFFDSTRRQEAQDIASRLGLHEQISNLPQGYMTPLSEQLCAGLPLGFRQRLALARALLDQPRLLLFDDASGALDDVGEAILRKTLTDIKGRATIIMVTQRPSLLVLADRTFRLSDGVLLSAED